MRSQENNTWCQIQRVVGGIRHSVGHPDAFVPGVSAAALLRQKFKRHKEVFWTEAASLWKTSGQEIHMEEIFCRLNYYCWTQKPQRVHAFVFEEGESEQIVELSLFPQLRNLFFFWGILGERNKCVVLFWLRYLSHRGSYMGIFVSWLSFWISIVCAKRKYLVYIEKVAANMIIA